MCTFVCTSVCEGRGWWGVLCISSRNKQVSLFVLPELSLAHFMYIAWCAPIRIPLVQCKQQFNSMEVKYSDNLKQLMDETAHKFQLDDLTYSSFVARWGYKYKVS